MKYKLCSFIATFFFLFNVHASISHDVEHKYHINNKLEHNISDCLVKYNISKSVFFNKSPYLPLLLVDDYFEKVTRINFFPVKFFYYNSRAP